MEVSENKIPKYVFYKPRNTLYVVLFHVKIKHSSTNIWEDGIAYREVGNPDSQVYTRQLDNFGDKWEIHY